jgi:hypothetical protein
MGHLSTFPSAPPNAHKQLQLLGRLDAFVGAFFALSLVVGMSFFDVVMSSAAWWGVGATAGMCALLFYASRQRWTMLLLALILVAARMALGFIAAEVEGKALFASCLAASIVCAAPILRKARAAAQ